MRALALLLLLAPAGALARERCVALPRGAELSSRPAARAVAGKARRPVRAFVEKGGPWTRLRLESLGSEPTIGGGQTRITEAHVVVFARAGGLEPAACPEQATTALLTVAGTFAGLRWKDGREAGGAETASLLEDARGSKERVTLDGEEHACFDHEIAGATVHVCASCAVMAAAASHELMGAGPPCR